MNSFELRALDIGEGEWGRQEVIEALKSGSKDAVLSCLLAISRKGEYYAMLCGYAADVAALTRETDPEVAAAACEAMGDMGKAGEDFAYVVAGALKAQSGEVRAAAATALGRFGGSAMPYQAE